MSLDGGRAWYHPAMTGDGEKDADPLVGLKSTLDETVRFPSVYVFKFIVPAGELDVLMGHLGEMPTTERQSSGGKYVSVTSETVVISSDEVIDVYRRTSVVKGLMSL